MHATMDIINSSAYDTVTNERVAVKKLTNPFQSEAHAKGAFRQLRVMKMVNHKNVCAWGGRERLIIALASAIISQCYG